MYLLYIYHARVNHTEVHYILQFTRHSIQYRLYYAYFVTMPCWTNYAVHTVSHIIACQACTIYRDTHHVLYRMSCVYPAACYIIYILYCDYTICAWYILTQYTSFLIIMDCAYFTKHTEVYVLHSYQTVDTATGGLYNTRYIVLYTTHYIVHVPHLTCFTIPYHTTLYCTVPVHSTLNVICRM